MGEESGGKERGGEESGGGGAQGAQPNANGKEGGRTRGERWSHPTARVPATITVPLLKSEGGGSCSAGKSRPSPPPRPRPRACRPPPLLYGTAGDGGVTDAAGGTRHRTLNAAADAAAPWHQCPPAAGAAPARNVHGGRGAVPSRTRDDAHRGCVSVRGDRRRNWTPLGEVPEAGRRDRRRGRCMRVTGGRHGWGKRGGARHRRRPAASSRRKAGEREAVQRWRRRWPTEGETRFQAARIVVDTPAGEKQSGISRVKRLCAECLRPARRRTVSMDVGETPRSGSRVRQRPLVSRSPAPPMTS